MLRAVVLVAALSIAWSKACEGDNLPTDAPLRIGKKFKPETCEKTSKPGDKLSMHYSAPLLFHMCV